MNYYNEVARILGGCARARSLELPLAVPRRWLCRSRPNSVQLASKRLGLGGQIAAVLRNLEPLAAA
jgi:hypothetical protein